MTFFFCGRNIKIILYIIYFMRFFLYVNIAENPIISYLLACSHSDNFPHIVVQRVPTLCYFCTFILCHILLAFWLKRKKNLMKGDAIQRWVSFFFMNFHWHGCSNYAKWEIYLALHRLIICFVTSWRYASTLFFLLWHFSSASSFLFSFILFVIVRVKN